MDMNAWGRVTVSTIVVSGFIAVLVLVITTKTQGNAPPEVMLVMLGALGAGFQQVISYWVGSSSGSTTKDDSIQNLATTSAKKEVEIEVLKAKVPDAVNTDVKPAEVIIKNPDPVDVKISAEPKK